MGNGTLFFDVETHSADLLYTMPPEEFVRLIGYKWVGSDEVTITTDLEELREVIRSARMVGGHRIHSFDLPAVFGIRSDEPLQMAIDRRAYDTWTHAVLVNPAPFQAMNRKGRMAKYSTPDQMKGWFSLDEQAFQLGVPGKSHDLKALAKEFGGFGEIPVDDPRFVDYLKHDVLASEHVGRALLKKGPLDAYALREQEIESRKAVIECNGVRTDMDAAQERVDELAERRQLIMTRLVEKYDFPTEGKSPWASNAGKEAIFAVLKDHGITQKSRPGWPLTSTGNLSLGGDALKSLTAGTEAEEIGTALAELKGQRSLAQLAIDSTHPDGFVHPQITMLQRSGRWSTTEPGLTVWTARGPGAVEKRYFVPDNEDEVFLEIDYSNADARMVAALSGDLKFAERFEPGADGHLINAIAAWGYDTVMATEESRAEYRQKAKVPGHGWGYRIGATTLNKQTGLPIEEGRTFLKGMNKSFPGVVRWQDSCVKYAARHGYVMNDWGRKMWVEKGREYTQAPALMGQSGTREIVCDAILSFPPWALRRLKAQIHDALLFSVPKDSFDRWCAYFMEKMTAAFKPKVGGQLIEFPVTAGPPGANWWESGH